MASAVVRKRRPRIVPEKPNDVRRQLRVASSDRLANLDKLAGHDIETSLVASLSRDLHTLFDPVSDGALPIYFGPLLGRLYLEGL